MRTSLGCLAALLLPLSASAASTPPPLGIPDLTGPRTLALSAGIGLASGTESLPWNPGALAARRRYAADAFYLNDRRPTPPGGSSVDGQYAGLSVIDSATTPAAVAVQYQRAFKGVYQGSMYAGGIAGALSDQVFLGVAGRYLDLHGPGKPGAWTSDVGLFFQLTPAVALGGAAYNVLATRRGETTPRGYGAGITAGSERSLQVTADWRTLDLPGGRVQQYGGGAELLVGGTYVLRGGYRAEDGPGKAQQFWSAGLGVVSDRLALDVGFRQSLDDAKARTFAVALRGFFPTE